MKEIVDIIMRRDGMSENEAWGWVEQTCDEINAAIADGRSINEIEDIMYDMLGLEPDYIEALIEW